MILLDLHVIFELGGVSFKVGTISAKLVFILA